MNRMRLRSWHVTPVLFLLANIALAVGPLPSWNEGATRFATVKFVSSVTEEGGPDFVPVVERIAVFEFIDDKAGKPEGIHRSIGRRPIAAFGNSDGDFEMLEWTTSGPGKRLSVIIHHIEPEREWAYDRKSPVGRLDRAIDEAPKRGWVLMDMKEDWNAIYPLK